MPLNLDRMKAVFQAALEKPAADRATYLDAACGEDDTLRQQIEALLFAHGEADPLLDRPAAEHLGQAAPADQCLDFLAPPRRPDSLGRIDHYEVLEVLGRGAFGIVFRAHDETLQRVVAVKVLAPQLAVTSPARKRFLREAQSSAGVRHENVVQVHAVGEKPLPYLVMEFIPGETLQQRLDRCGPLDTAEVVRIGRQIAEGLAAAHARGLIHRDIKPANILIEDGPCGHVKITDFGLARAADDASLTQSGFIAGTPMYMAPEQAAGEAMDHRADLFSLGSVLYTMASGRPPFRASSTLAILKRVTEDTPRPIREIISEVPPWLCDVIGRLHAKSAADRFASAQQVADALGRHLARTQPPEGELATTLDQVAPARRPRRGLAAAALAVLMLAGLGVTEATGVTKVRGTVLQLFSADGTLVVEVDDPGVSVTVDGEDVVITGAGAKEIRLKPGKYTVLASKDGKVLRREVVSVERDGRRVVRVTHVPPPPEKKAPDRAAAEYVLSIGGKVQVNGEDREIETVTDLPLEPFRLTGARLDHNDQVRARVSDAGLANFAGCKHLTYLALAHSPVSDAGVAHFKDCKTFTRLHLPGVQVSEAGLAHFKGCKDLTQLVLAHNANVRDGALAPFADCKNLTMLNLIQTQVTDAGLAHFSRCKNLTNLSLADNPGVGDAGVAHFADCKHLTWLDLTATRVSDKGLAPFAGCKGLTHLHLGNCPEIGDAGLAHFKGCKNVTWLSLHTSKVGDAGVAHLEGCRNLTILELNNSSVSEAGLAKLADHKNLAHLHVQATKATPKVIDGLKVALPRCRIEWDGGDVPPR